MSDLNSTINFLESVEEIKNPPMDEIKVNNSDEFHFFDIGKFSQELFEKSDFENKKRAMRPVQNITGYDIAVNCIQNVLFKLRNTPLENYANSWLPIFMRTEIGTGVHNFIQKNTKQFTETEVNLKVPSIRFYGKIDYLINNNILGEIKTMTYEDYRKCVKDQTPREKDFLQAYCYKYILTKYIDEIKSDDTKVAKFMGEKPKLDNYNIQKLQFLYIAHDIIASECGSYAEMLQSMRNLKKNLSSKNNPFFFITSIVVDLNEKICKEFDEFIENKIADIHYYLETNTNPKDNSRYVIKSCYFCPYKEICTLEH